MSDKIVQFNEEVIKGQLKELVRGSVEETLNELLEKKSRLLHKRLVMSASLQQLPAMLRYICHD